MHVPLDTPTEHVTWNQTRLNKRRLAQRILAHRVVESELQQPGFVHTRGDKGWLLIGPVFHQGGLYRRHDAERGTVYGSVGALLEAGMEVVELLSPADVLRLALDRGDYLRIARHSDGQQRDVAMLHPWATPAQPRTCAIWLDERGGLAASCPEITAPYNKSAARWRIVAPLRGGELEARLRALLSALTGEPLTMAGSIGDLDARGPQPVI
jgi:hypothetical protein